MIAQNILMIITQILSGNKEVGITTGGKKAIAEGESMAVSEGRVHTVQYHPITDAIGKFWYSLYLLMQRACLLFAV